MTLRTAYVGPDIVYMMIYPTSHAPLMLLYHYVNPTIIPLQD